MRCPCDSGQAYAQCCAPLHAGAKAASAEALMRSRYSAYGLRLSAYLLASWHASTRPAALNLSDDATVWLGLHIKRTESIGNHATVEFIARHRLGGGTVKRLHEVSHFVFEHDGWWYLDGEFPTAS